MKFSSLDGGEGGEYNGLAKVEISKIFFCEAGHILLRNQGSFDTVNPGR